MDIQDQTKTTSPSGHNSHQVHICHRCGWPFPNPHPSSKHRRAHKRICGTIEGYTKLFDSEQPASDDEHVHSDEEDNEKTPSPMIEKRIIKESGSGAGGIEERSNKSEEDLFSDAVTEFSDSGISPDASKLFSSPIGVKKVDDELEVFGTADSHTQDADKTEDNDVNTLSDSVDTKTSVPLVVDKDGTHEDKFIDLVDPSNTVQTTADSAKVTDKFEVSDNKGQVEESVHVLSVPSDIPLLDHADTLIQDFRDHKSIHSVQDFEVKPAEEKIEESQISENAEPSMESVVSKDAEAQHLEISKTIPEEIIEEKLESDHEHGPQMVKETEVDHGVPVFTEASTPETVKELESGTKVEQKIVGSVSADSKDSGNFVITQISEKLLLEKTEQSNNASGLVTETVVDESDGKLMTGQDCGVDPSIGSSSRNSLEGNWGSVSVLSTASIDAENAHSIGKSEPAADKSRLGKSDASEGSSLVQLKEEPVDQKPSEIKTVTVQNSQPSKSEASGKVGNETEGRKRNEEAIAKVKNWSTGEAKSSNPTQLSAMIQKDEVPEKATEPGVSNLTLEPPPVNQESSPPKYIDEGKKVGKKAKGRAAWMPFVCCSSVNVN